MTTAWNSPEDVTLMWCDDNYGYITRLSNAAEQARSGGAGSITTSPITASPMTTFFGSQRRSLR